MEEVSRERERRAEVKVSEPIPTISQHEPSERRFVPLSASSGKTSDVLVVGLRGSILSRRLSSMLLILHFDRSYSS